MNAKNTGKSGGPTRQRPGKPSQRTIDLQANLDETGAASNRHGDKPEAAAAEPVAVAKPADEPAGTSAAASSAARQAKPDESGAASARHGGKPEAGAAETVAVAKPADEPARAPADASSAARQAKPAAGAGATGSGSPATSVPESGKPATGPSGDGPRPTPARPADRKPGPPPRPEGARWGAVLAAGLVGAVIALLGAAALAYSGLVPGTAAMRDESLANDIARLDGQQSQIKELQASMASEIAELRKRTEAMEQTASAVPGDDQARVDELASSVNELQAALAAVQENVASLPQTQVAAAAPTGDASAQQSSLVLQDKLAELEARLAETERRLPGEEGSGTAAAAPAAGIDALETGLRATTSSVEAVDSRVDALEKTVQSLQARTEDLASTGQRERRASEALAKSVAADGLRSALQTGEPLAPALDRVAAIAGSGEAVDSLRTMDAVPTTAQLRASFDAAAETIIASAEPPADGVVNRLMASARSLVKVRPTGPMEGDTPVAIVSRIRSALASEDFAAALSAWQGLPEPSRAASQAWADQLQKRIRAQQLVDEVVDDLVSGS